MARVASLRLVIASLAAPLALAGCPSPTTPADASDASDIGITGDSFDAPSTDDTIEPPTDAPDVVIGAPDVSDPRYAPVVDDLWQSMQRAYVPGAAIAIVEDGHLAFATGLGVKRRGRIDPVDADTLFKVGSLSKMITAATVMSLVEDGRIDLNAPITDYATFFQLRAPFDPTTLHTHHLLTHTAGLPEAAFSICPVTPYAISEWYRDHTDTPLWSPPGAVWDYSNQNFIVAGLVAETAAAMPFGDLVQARVFGPAGMTNATLESAVAQTRDHATGHIIGTNGESGLTFEPISSDCGYGRPAGGVYASVVDYAHFVETMLAGGGTMLNSTSVDAMTADQVATHDNPVEHYGYGFNTTPYREVRLVEHGGLTTGFQTTLVMVPERRFAVIIFGNSTFYNPRPVALRAVTRLLGLTGTVPSYRTDPSTWTDFAGTYNDPIHLGQIVVELRGTQLWARVGTHADALLTQIAGDHFTIGVESGFVLDGVTFWRDAAGPATYFVSREGVAQRVP